MNATTITTRSGRHFDLAAPTPDMVTLEDIAIPLSYMPRWNCHQSSSPQISVLEHSVRVAMLVQEMSLVRLGPERVLLPGGVLYVFAAAFHDGHEAYTGDISSPMKALLGRERTNAIEQRIDEAIAYHFGFPADLMRSALVKKADAALLATEARDVMGHAEVYGANETPLAMRIEPWSQAEALERFTELVTELRHRRTLW